MTFGLLTAVVSLAAAAVQVLVGQVDHDDDEPVSKGGRRPARLFVSSSVELEPHLDGISLVALGQVCNPSSLTLTQRVSSGGGDLMTLEALSLSAAALVSCLYHPGTLGSLPIGRVTSYGCRQARTLTRP